MDGEADPILWGQGGPQRDQQYFWAVTWVRLAMELATERLAQRVLSRWVQRAIAPVVQVAWIPQKSGQGQPKVKGPGVSQVAVQELVEQPETTQKAALAPIAVEKPAWLAEQLERVAGENLVPWGSIGSRSLPSMINVYSIYSSVYRLNLLLFLLMYAYF